MNILSEDQIVAIIDKRIQQWNKRKQKPLDSADIGYIQAKIDELLVLKLCIREAKK